MNMTPSLPRLGGVLAVGATLLATASAAQASAPAVSTGSAINISPQSASLRGAVNAHGKQTVFFVQYGRTSAYGSQTPDLNAGVRTNAVTVSADVIGLLPATTYHFRVFARNADGTTGGGDKSFKTAKQPLGFTLAATPNPTLFAGTSTLQGVLSGTGNAGRQVILQQKAFPYTAKFTNVGNPQVTGTTGSFAFPLLALTTNAQYRVITTGAPTVTSSVVTLGIAVQVKSSVSTRHVRRGHSVRFSGTVTPAKPGALYAVQKLNSKGGWTTVAGGTSTVGGTTYSRYSKHVKIRHGGSYRVFVGVADGFQVSNVGSTVYIHTR